MTGRAQRQSVLLMTITVLILCAMNAPAQEKISPVSDFQYKKDYAEFEAIKKEADAQKRSDLLVDFVKKHPISRMLLYVTSEYLECVKPLIQSKDWTKVISMEEAFLALLPTEKTVQAEGVPEPGAGDFIKNQLIPAQKTVLQGLMAAYYQSNNLPKAAEIGEKVYALAPDKTMAATLADLYLKMQNTDKFLQYGDKVVAEFPADQSYGTALQMGQIYMQKHDIAKARALYAKVSDAFGEKVPPGIQPQAWASIRAIAQDPLAEYSLPAAEAYAQKDYPKAVELYEKVAQKDPKRDDAYYYIGMSKWNSKDPEGAIEAFAKAAVLGKANAKKAQQYLEDLYKARHNNTLDGLDQVMAKAKADLGIS